MSAGPTTTDTPPDAPRPSAIRRLSLALSDIKLAHSVFALPFAILAAVLVAPVGLARTDSGEWIRFAPAGWVKAVPARPAGWRALPHPRDDIDWGAFAGMLVLVVVCMVFARTWAMLVNRLADREFDAANPRTARRAFASGSLTSRDGVAVVAGSAAGFVLACALFGFFYANWWPAILSVPVLAWIALYSFTKRFTWLCHLFLGGALAASPLAAALAVDGSFWVFAQGAIDEGTRVTVRSGASTVVGYHRFMPGLAVPWLAAMVLLWVAGFDVIYALQDLDFDRETGLKSVPARFGWRGAAWIARGLHALALAALAVAWVVEPRFGWVFGVGFAIVAGALVLEHAVLARRGRAGIPMAFFTLNGVVSLALGAAGVVDAVW
ncbi:MAG: 4-hydroxybenzoate octaprenyltransferase [Phycisphaerales bacterium]